MYYHEESSTNTLAIIILVVVIVEMIVWGIAAAVIAYKRGRDPIGWFFLGFGGIWFAIITLMLLPPIGGDYKRCPACAEMISVWASKCPHCSYLYKVTRPTTQTEPSVRKCPGCGAKIEEGFRQCPSCGRALPTKCESCGKGIKPEWNTCPQCGNVIRINRS